MADKVPILAYAPAPKPMSRKRLALLIGSATTASIVTGGVLYCASPATQPRPAVVMGDMVAPPVVLQPQPPTTMPMMLGGAPAAPVPWKGAPTTQPTDEAGR